MYDPILFCCLNVVYCLLYIARGQKKMEFFHPVLYKWIREVLFLTESSFFFFFFFCGQFIYF